MILIHGKVKDIEVLNDSEIWNIKFTLNDGDIHEYFFANNKIVYVATSGVIEELNKNIELCDDTRVDTISYDNNKISIKVIIDNSIFNNTFSIKK